MEKTYHKYVEVPNLKNFGYGIRYLDDDYTIYVAPHIYRQIADKELGQLTYFVLSYTRKQKPIDEIAMDIILELEKCVSGPATMELIKGILEEKDKSFINPDVIVSPIQVTRLTGLQE